MGFMNDVASGLQGGPHGNSSLGYHFGQEEARRVAALRQGATNFPPASPSSSPPPRLSSADSAFSRRRSREAPAPRAFNDSYLSRDPGLQTRVFPLEDGRVWTLEGPITNPSLLAHEPALVAIAHLDDAYELRRVLWSPDARSQWAWFTSVAESGRLPGRIGTDRCLFTYYPGRDNLHWTGEDIVAVVYALHGWNVTGVPAGCEFRWQK